MTTGIGLTLPPPLPPTSPTPTVRALPLPRLAQVLSLTARHELTGCVRVQRP